MMHDVAAIPESLQVVWIRSKLEKHFKRCKHHLISKHDIPQNGAGVLFFSRIRSPRPSSATIGFFFVRQGVASGLTKKRGVAGGGGKGL